MRRLAILLSLASLLSLQTAFGQALGDIALFLLYEPGKTNQGKNDFRRYFPDEKLERQETSYYFLGALYDAYELEFISYKRELNSRTVSGRELKSLPVVTINQLREFIASSFPRLGPGYDSGAYFGKLKKIYIVECVSKRKATVTEVEFNITRE